MAEAPFLSLPPGGLEPAACWWMKAGDGVRVRAAHWRGEAPQALAVLLNGRTEFIEKTAVPAAALVERGYEVVSLDWRGQGLSDRATESRLKGHVGGFAEFQRDLDALLASDAVRNAVPGKRLLVAHSMGGAIATGGVQRPNVAALFDAVVLSAPMYGIAMGVAARVGANLVTSLGMMLRQGRKWPPFGDVATPYALSGADPNVLTHDSGIWNWLGEMAREYEELNIATPTLGWLDAAQREMARLALGAPLTLPSVCLLGTAEEVVDPASVRRTAGRLGVDVVEIAGARHEHFHESPEYRTQAWAAIDRFLEEQGLPTG